MTEYKRIIARANTEVEDFMKDNQGKEYYIESVGGVITYIKTNDDGVKTYAISKGFIVK